MAGGTGAGPQISVDMSGLTRLANDLSRYADQAIQGEADNARGALGTGVPFGSASASGYVYSAKHRYHQNLRRVIDTLREFAAEGRALSAGAGSAATNYRAADTSAAARTASAGSPLAGTGGGPPPGAGPAVTSSTGGGTGGGTGTTAAGAAGDEGFTPVAGWCTNWSAYDVQALWKMVEPDNVCEGWNHVLAWQRVADAVNTQIGVLVDKQRQLAQLWPADANTAATAFMGRLDTLIATMRRTAAAAAATKTAMERINEELSSAQVDLRGYHEKYRSKSTDLIPSALDGAEDEVTKEARARSAKLEQAVHTAAATMAPIPKFKARQEVEPPPPGQPPGGGGGRGGGGSTVPASAVVPPLAHDPPSPLPGTDAVLPAGTQWTPDATGPSNGGGGPQLSGISSHTPGGLGTVPPGGITPPGGTPTGVSGIGGGPLPTPVGGLPAGGAPRLPAGMLAPGMSPGGAGQPRTTSARAGVPGRPIEGVIGATPVTGSGARPLQGGPGAGSVPGRPTGGVIGGSAPGSGLIGGQPAGQGGTSRSGPTGGTRAASGSGTSAGGSVPGSAMPMGAPSGGRGRGDSTQPGGDPDNPWAVREGGAPVIEPDTRPHRHDPGPGVIGVDL